MAPEQRIRDYLDDNGGETQATVQHLLSTFQVGEHDTEGRERIVEGDGGSPRSALFV